MRVNTKVRHVCRLDHGGGSQIAKSLIHPSEKLAVSATAKSFQRKLQELMRMLFVRPSYASYFI